MKKSDKDNENFAETENLYVIEKKLGRHKKREAEEKQIKRTKNFMKYFLLITNMVYILTVPILAMIGFYTLLRNTLLNGKENPLLLVVFLFLGAITGYWSLIKELMKINKMEDKEREKKDEYDDAR